MSRITRLAIGTRAEQTVLPACPIGLLVAARHVQSHRQRRSDPLPIAPSAIVCIDSQSSFGVGALHL